MSLLQTTANCSKGSMGFSWGLELDTLTLKKKNRWLFKIPGYVTGTAPMLPPKKAGRPSIQMKEFEFQHLHESIWYPFKGTWKPINITLYDIRCNENVMFDWLFAIYSSQASSAVTFSPALQPTTTKSFKIPKCTLELYNGCGNVIETWIYENAYPSDINWGELDMNTHDIVFVDFILRYDRAYLG